MIVLYNYLGISNLLPPLFTHQKEKGGSNGVV